ncbi:hypothetical protein R4P52_24240 [Rhodococcus sp. IEGM 1374]|nr:hypothetical protein [Rhodococcus sp. IEGM 1374]
MAYLRSESTAQAAQTLQVSVPTLSQRLKTMRKAGVKVPKKTGRTKSLSMIEVAQLNNMIIKHEKEMAKA